jgi:hypothetical protein
MDDFIITSTPYYYRVIGHFPEGKVSKRLSKCYLSVGITRTILMRSNELSLDLNRVTKLWLREVYLAGLPPSE